MLDLCLNGFIISVFSLDRFHCTVYTGFQVIQGSVQTGFTVLFIQDFRLSRVQFRQVSLYCLYRNRVIQGSVLGFTVLFIQDSRLSRVPGFQVIQDSVQAGFTVLFIQDSRLSRVPGFQVMQGSVQAGFTILSG